MQKVWLGSESVLLLLEANFLLLGAPLSAGRFMGRKRYLFLHIEGNELDWVSSRLTLHQPPCLCSFFYL